MTDNAGRLPYIALARKMFESYHLWLEPRVFSRWEAWVDLIQEASWHRRQWAIPGGLIELVRGETIPLSRSHLAKRWGWSENKVWRFLRLLKNERQIQTGKETAKGTTYLLLNYDRYQGSQTGRGTTEDTVRRRPVDGPQTETEAGKAGKAGKAVKTSRSRAPQKSTNEKGTPGKPTWLTPYLDDWQEVYGGELPPKRAAAALGPLHTKYGDDEVLPRWRFYLEQHRDKPGIATPQGFAQTYGSWEPREEPMSAYSTDENDLFR